MAIPAISTPQMILNRPGGFGLPRLLIMLSTSTAESPEVTKNTITSSVAATDMICPKGRTSSMANSARATSDLTVSASGICCQICIVSALPPKTENHRKAASEGASTVPMMNSLSVRPRETRAMNSPTKGDHEIHQAQ